MQRKCLCTTKTRLMANAHFNEHVISIYYKDRKHTSDLYSLLLQQNKCLPSTRHTALLMIQRRRRRRKAHTHTHTHGGRCIIHDLLDTNWAALHSQIQSEAAAEMKCWFGGLPPWLGWQIMWSVWRGVGGVWARQAFCGRWWWWWSLHLQLNVCIEHARRGCNGHGHRRALTSPDASITFPCSRLAWCVFPVSKEQCLWQRANQTPPRRHLAAGPYSAAGP